MKQKTSMFGSAMSSYSNPQIKENDSNYVSNKVGRPKGSSKKVSTKSSFTTKLDNNMLTILKTISEEKSQPINRILEDLVQYALISIGRNNLYHTDAVNKSEHDRQCKYDLKVIADRYKEL